MKEAFAAGGAGKLFKSNIGTPPKIKTPCKAWYFYFGGEVGTRLMALF